MVDYNVFREILKEKLLDYMPGEFKGYSVSIRRDMDINGVADILTVMPAGQQEAYMVPEMKVGDLYEIYRCHDDLAGILSYAGENYAEEYRANMKVRDSIIEGKAGEHVIMKLINTAANEELLKNIPHREFHDLSVVYQWMVSVDVIFDRLVTINHDMAGMLGMTEQELFEAGSRNTRNAKPPTIETLASVCGGGSVNFPEQAGCSAEYLSSLPEQEKEETLWLISNASHSGGAVSMLYEDVLHNLADYLGDDLYIMPVSVDEVIAVPAGREELEYLSEMLIDGNAGITRECDRLSNDMYLYDRKLREVKMATDVKDKSFNKPELPEPVMAEMIR